MKTAVTITLIFWMILTVVLTCTGIGILLFIPKDSWQNQENTPSTWMTIGRKLLSSLTDNKI